MNARVRNSVLLLAALLLCGAARADDKEDCQKKSGDEAIAACNRAIDSGANRGVELAKLYFWRGAEWSGKGDRDRAIKDFEESVRIDPARGEVFISLGHAFRNQGNLERALASYSEAIKLDANDAEGFYYRANAYRAKGDLDRAIADYDAAIKVDPEDADLYNGRGIAYAAKGDLDGAIGDYDSALALDSDLAQAYANRADAYRLKGDVSRAIVDYNDAIRLDPKDVSAIARRAGLYRTRGDYDRAIAGFSEVIRTAPGQFDALYERGVAYALKRDFDRAIADLDEAIKAEPGHVPAYQARGLAYAAKGEPARAIADYSEAIRLDPENAERYVVRAWQSFRMGRLQLALLDIDLAIRLDPDLVAAYSTRARIREAAGDKELAAADRRAATEARARRERAERERVAALDQLANTRKRTSADAEKSFVAEIKRKYEYAYPIERAAIALGYKYDDARAIDGDNLTDEGRAKLAAYQRKNRLAASGYLDNATFDKLIEEPVNVDLFKVDQPEEGTPVAIGDWFMTRDKEWCSVWAKPVAIRGKFLPNFNEIPLFRIAREIDDDGNSISPNFANGDLFEKGAQIYIDAEGSRLRTEEFGGDYGPERYCNERGCFAKDDVYKALIEVGSFKVIGPSRLGDRLVIEYSARGFESAFRRMDTQCARGRIGTWLE